ncbi:MAG: deoxyribose-phosphate aldolase [Clostridia bacterium]|nr:deoxyribose-phosphate aldolase [Clostridia bacterium]
MDIRKLIDHTLLKPDASEEAIKRICDEAKEHGFKSVCVNPSRVGFVAEQLEGSDVLPCCVIGFPLGATLPEVKAFEAAAAIEEGAKELDMVINIGAAKDGNWELVKKDIEAVVTAANGEAAVKVIIETCLLTDEEKVLACQCAMEAGADFVKTSTGFSTGGTTEQDVALMRKVVGENLGVKASGGVRTPEDAEKFIKAGASRLGTSNGVKLLG